MESTMNPAIEAPKPRTLPARIVGRTALGLGLSGLYGVALGLRAGGVDLIKHAVGVPFGLVAVAGLGVPALVIILTLFKVPVSVPAVSTAVARATMTTGLMLAGLAPGVGLYVVTSEGPMGALLAAVSGLLLAGGLGLWQMLRDLSKMGDTAPESLRPIIGLSILGFAGFATLLAARVWWSALPMIGGAL